MKLIMWLKKLLEEIIAKIIIKSAKATVIMYMPTPIDSNPRKETAIAPARSYNLSVKTRDVVVFIRIPLEWQSGEGTSNIPSSRFYMTELVVLF